MEHRTELVIKTRNAIGTGWRFRFEKKIVKEFGADRFFSGGDGFLSRVDYFVYDTEMSEYYEEGWRHPGPGGVPLKDDFALVPDEEEGERLYVIRVNCPHLSEPACSEADRRFLLTLAVLSATAPTSRA